MIRCIKVWWVTRILKKVYCIDGKPVDCKGLQISKNGYTISDEWKWHSYIGRGMYLSDGGCLQADMKNPYYLEDLKVAMGKFKVLT